MAKFRFRSLPTVIEAMQWFKDGCYPLDACEIYDTREGESRENKMVRDHSISETAQIGPLDDCSECGQMMCVHGWIDTLKGEHIVCPGDWIFIGVGGAYGPCKPSIFAATYEALIENGHQ